MSIEFTIQEVQEMLQETHDTRKENLRLQSLTTNEFLLNVLAEHYQDLLNDTAELQTMLTNLNDDSRKSYAQLTYEMAQDEYDYQSDEDFVSSVW